MKTKWLGQINAGILTSARFTVSAFASWDEYQFRKRSEDQKFKWKYALDLQKKFGIWRSLANAF